MTARVRDTPVAEAAMVGLGVLMIVLGVWGAGLWLRGGPERSRAYLVSAMLMGPAGFAAVICGWIVAEVGRQPYVVYGVLRTADAVSPVRAGQVSVSLLGFLIVYAIIFSVGLLYILRLIAHGPGEASAPSPETPRAPGSPLAAAIEPPEGPVGGGER